VQLVAHWLEAPPTTMFERTQQTLPFAQSVSSSQGKPMRMGHCPGAAEQLAIGSEAA